MLATKLNASTLDFVLKKGGEVISRVHRVVSADGKTLTVHNTGVLPAGVTGDQTLVFDKQQSSSTRVNAQGVQPRLPFALIQALRRRSSLSIAWAILTFLVLDYGVACARRVMRTPQ